MQRAPFERLKKRRSNMLPVLLSQNGGTSCIVQYSAVPERLLKERIVLALFFYKIEVYLSDCRLLRRKRRGIKPSARIIQGMYPAALKYLLKPFHPVRA